jgi:uncharacterized heparinase superfamily protein
MSEQLGWYWRRVRAMSPSEVAARSRRSLGNVVDAGSFHVGRAVWRARWEPHIDKLLVRDPLSAPVGILAPERAAGLRARFPYEAGRLLDRAAGVLEGRARFFGYPEVVLAPEAHDADPFTGRHWPNQHAKRIDYRRDDVGDPKWIWELNRCQFLPLLAAAWLVSGDRQYAQAASDRLESWVDAHPPGRGIAWSSGFEAGIRAISLATAVDALRGSEFLDADPLAKALVSLWQHARWIERDPSIGSSANNHRIGELVGLLVIGAMAPELRPASRWLDDALESLDQEVERQILADGTSVEQAFSYHVFVLDLLLVAVAALDSAGRSLPPALTAGLERSGDALWAQLGEGEPAPTYGDTDDGRALVVDDRDLRDPRGVAAGIAARLGHAKAARVAGRLDPTAWWLFGAEGADRFAQVQPAPEPGSVTLPDCGLTILRSGRRRAMIDHGPHGYLSLAAHAHADALRFDMSLGGEQLVVDPGVGSYFARPRLREAFRGTGFHATVLVDDTDSSEPGGPFLWTRHASTRILNADAEAGVVIAEHDGYERLEDPVSHRRTVLGLGEGESIVVIDRLEARGAHHYSQRWPLHPALDLDERTIDKVVARGEKAGLLLAVASSRPFLLNAVKGQADPPAGWWSARLESSIPSWLLTVDLRASGSVEVATLLVPFESDSTPQASIGLDVTASRTVVELAGADPGGTIELDLASPVPRVRRQTATSAV